MVWKKIPLIIGCLLAASVVFAAEDDDDAAAGTEPSYIGVEACGKCHKKKKKGNQLEQWQSTGHAKAFAVLGDAEKVKDIIDALGIADAQKEAKCLVCHATAHGVPADKVVAPKPGKKGFLIEDGVQCEDCHGPGSLYKKNKVMKDHDASIAAGMIVPDEKTCAKCHSGTDNAALVEAGHKPFDKFNFKEAWAKVEHPKPEAPAK